MASEPPSNRESSVHEAAAAKAAIRRVIEDTRHGLGTAVDVRLWTKKSPWIAVGLAATAGMAVAMLLRRGGRRAPMNDEAHSSLANQPANSKPPEPAHAGIGAAIASSLFDLAKFGLETAIASGIREATAKRSQPNEYQSETTQSAQ